MDLIPYVAIWCYSPGNCCSNLATYEYTKKERRNKHAHSTQPSSHLAIYRKRVNSNDDNNNDDDGGGGGDNLIMYG